ncbi:MAG: tetratricopeptide repeat protein [Deltaproteobacteria bacterium]|nr:tetratricopeptide repeat protein [Deltaproteobacteria bacterium]
MDVPVKELEQINGWMEQARTLESQKKWNEAREVLEKVLAIDPRNDKAFEHLGRVYDGLGDAQKGASFHARAKSLREEKWEREVEAEMRSHHEVIGEPNRREIP